MYQIRKIFKFEASHLLDSSFSKCCQQIHGHGYILEAFFKSEELNSDGMVVDFGAVKEIVNPIIEEWDHSLMLSIKSDVNKLQFPDNTVKIVNVPFNPTAENMAMFLYMKIKMKFWTLSKIRVHETATGYAEYYEV